MTYTVKSQSIATQEYVSFEPSKLPDFLTDGQMSYFCYNVELPDDFTYIEYILFDTDVFRKFNKFSRSIHRMNGTVVPGYEERSIGMTHDVDSESGKPFTLIQSDNGSVPVLNVFSYDSHRKNGDYVDVKIHFKLSNSL